MTSGLVVIPEAPAYNNGASGHRVVLGPAGGGAGGGGGLGRAATVVGADDRLHQRVTHDVHLGEVAEGERGDVAEQLLGVGEARPSPLGQVDLGDVAGDH